jgi:outer membrane protein TolC
MFHVCSRRRSFADVSALAISVVLAATSVAAKAQDVPLGRTLQGFLDEAQRLSPELAAAALRSDAARFAVGAAGPVADPSLRVSFEDIDRSASSAFPRRLGKVAYTVEQELPLWGKPKIRRGIAAAEADKARHEERQIAAELAERIKIAYARYVRAQESLKFYDDGDRVLAGVLLAAEAQYVGGRGAQRAVLKADQERARLVLERSAAERDHRMAMARIKSLLGRDDGSLLAAADGPRPLPPLGLPAAETLVRRAEIESPTLAADRAEIDAAHGARRLSERNWYPDVTVGLGLVDRDRRFQGYEAMLAVKLPLHQEWRAAADREAATKLRAAEARLRAASVRLRGAIESAYWAYQAADRNHALIVADLLPQDDLILESNLAAFEQGKTDIAEVLDAELRRRQTRLSALDVQMEREIALAEIERLIGGDL